MKILMISGLFISVIIIFFGLKSHKTIWGKILVIFGIVLWTFIGLIGLGTGT